MTVDECWQASLMPLLNTAEHKSGMGVDVRVFSTLVSRSNENKSCMRVDES